MKAAIGLLSDSVPIFGYHKRSYIVLVSFVGTVALLILGFVDIPSAYAPIAAFLLLLVNLQVAVVDLLTEGKYAELMVKRPETSSDLVSFVWGLNNLGGFIGSIVAGPMGDHLNPRYIFLVAVPVAAQVIIPTVTGWFPEERLPPDERGIRHDKLRKHPNLVKLSFFMTIGAVVVGMSALGPDKLQSILSLGSAFTLAILGFVWLPTTLSRANLYLFLNNMMYLSLSGAMDYWFTADEECVPGGPAFSLTFYNTFANLVASIAGIAGVALFQRFLSRGNFRVAFWTTGIIKLGASFFDYAIVKRYNKSVNISDHVAFMMGDAVIFQVVSMLELMPAVVLTSKVCPPGMEASVYALLASYQNLGQSVSRIIGAVLLDILKVKAKTPCNFEALPNAILIAHVALPALAFPLVWLLIPDAKLTDDLLGIDDQDLDNQSDFAPLSSADHNELPEDIDQIPPEVETSSHYQALGTDDELNEKPAERRNEQEDVQKDFNDDAGEDPFEEDPVKEDLFETNQDDGDVLPRRNKDDDTEENR